MNLARMDLMSKVFDSLNELGLSDLESVILPPSVAELAAYLGSFCFYDKTKETNIHVLISGAGEYAQIKIESLEPAIYYIYNTESLR